MIRRLFALYRNIFRKERLNQVIPLLLGKPNKVEIRVYTPLVPPQADAAFQDPWQLCHARCVATMKYLIEAGIDSDRAAGGR